MNDLITVKEFTDRLTRLCSGGRLTALPRRERDIAILLASTTLWMENGAVYSEMEINERLTDWMETGCPALALDAVTLRRELIDRRYLDRDDAGRHYTAGPGPSSFAFDPAIGSVEPARILETARRQREERKRAHVGGGIISEPTR